MDFRSVFTREAPDFAKPFMSEDAAWGPFVIEDPNDNESLGSQLLLDEGNITWIDVNDMGKSLTVEDGSLEESGDSITFKTSEGDEYIIRPLRDSDWEAFQFDGPVSVDEINEIADELFAPFDPEEDDEEGDEE